MLSLIYDIVTYSLAAVVHLALFAVMLRRTYEWTWLGRGLLLMFFTFGLGYSVAFLHLIGSGAPAWTTDALRLAVIVDALVILTALLKYPWAEPPDGIQWSRLLGLHRD